MLRDRRAWCRVVLAASLPLYVCFFAQAKAQGLGIETECSETVATSAYVAAGEGRDLAIANVNKINSRISRMPLAFRIVGRQPIALIQAGIRAAPEVYYMAAAMAIWMCAKDASSGEQLKSVSQLASDLMPPGNCGDDEYDALKDQVELRCKTFQRKCGVSNSQDEIAERIRLNLSCISAREEINNRCFDGGDDTHLRVLQEEYGVLKRCRGLLK